MAELRHGTATGYDARWHGCRCAECRAWNAARSRRGMQRRVESPVEHDIPHGHRTTYVHYGCRCDACRAANTAYQRSRGKVVVDG